jgi:ABC-2 type transport system permease protein
MSKYWHILVIYFKDALSCRQALASLSLLIIVRVAVLIGIYSFVFQARGQTSGGIGLSTAVWSIVAYFIFYSFDSHFIYRDISEDVRFGVLEQKLVKPYNYLIALSAQRLGKGLPRLIFGLLVVSAVLPLFFPLPAGTFSWPMIAGLVILFLGGLLLSLIFFSLIGLTAIWLEDAEPVYWIVSKSIMLFGGAYLPIAMFPPAVKFISYYTPFGLVTSITRAFNAGFATVWPTIFFWEIVWILVLGTLLIVLRQAADKKLSINGG